MDINPRGIFAIVMISIFIIASIIVGNWFFFTVFGIKFRDAPPLIRSTMHIVGAIIVAWIFVKFFKIQR